MRQKLGHALVQLGLPAAEALLGRFAAASNPERAALVQFLDAVSVDQPLPPETLNRIAGLLLEALKLADLRLRAEILNTRIFAHPQLSPEFRRAAAQALLPLLRSADHPETSDRAAALLEALGEVAAEGPARRRAQAARTRRRRTSRSASLGRILAAHPDRAARRSRRTNSFRERVAAPATRAGRLRGGARADRLLAGGQRRRRAQGARPAPRPARPRPLARRPGRGHRPRRRARRHPGRAARPGQPPPRPHHRAPVREGGRPASRSPDRARQGLRDHRPGRVRQRDAAGGGARARSRSRSRRRRLRRCGGRSSRSSCASGRASPEWTVIWGPRASEALVRRARAHRRRRGRRRRNARSRSSAA